MKVLTPKRPKTIVMPHEAILPRVVKPADLNDREQAARMQAHIAAEKAKFAEFIGEWKKARRNEQLRYARIRAKAPLPRLRKPGHRPSPYRGVSWNRRDRLWVVRVKVRDGLNPQGLFHWRSRVVGIFLPSEVQDAARCYDAAVRLFVGSGHILFPIYNFPDNTDAPLPSEAIAERAKAHLLSIARDHYRRTGREPLPLELMRLVGMARNRVCRWIRELKESGDWSQITEPPASAN